ncbi:hypothetical protein [Enterobacter kobei]|uniref:hypothetical protein n=1 Tax=Enterobacter kobei TaxID=208224 RepID=UPI003CFA28FE
MEKTKLTIDQRLQIARMATDIVVEGMRAKLNVKKFTREQPSPENDHELFTFIYRIIEEKVTDESGCE